MTAVSGTGANAHGVFGLAAAGNPLIASPDLNTRRIVGHAQHVDEDPPRSCPVRAGRGRPRRTARQFDERSVAHHLHPVVGQLAEPGSQLGAHVGERLVGDPQPLGPQGVGPGRRGEQARALGIVGVPVRQAGAAGQRVLGRLDPGDLGQADGVNQIEDLIYALLNTQQFIFVR